MPAGIIRGAFAENQQGFGIFRLSVIVVPHTPAILDVGLFELSQFAQGVPALEVGQRLIVILIERLIRQIECRLIRAAQQFELSLMRDQTWLQRMLFQRVGDDFFGFG